MDEELTLGIIAYKQHDFEEAIALLSAGDQRDWMGQLYLGMSYHMTGQSVEAQKVFLRMRDECPDQDLRAKAQAAFIAIKQKQSAERTKDKTEEDYGTIEWG